MKRAARRMDFRGDLQTEVMAVVWELGEARVDDVRGKQTRSLAYTTVQTVMNRLVERGVLQRERRGHAYVYSARYDEAEYLSRSIGDRLREASPAARQAALHNLMGELEPEDLDDLSRLARRIRNARRDS